MSPRLPKCPVCGEMVSKDSISRKLKGRTYHAHCYENMVKEKYQQNIEQQQDPLNDLRAYICKLFRIKEVTPMIESQIIRYAKEFKMTPSQIQFCLVYFFEYCENSIEEAQGIGIIPYVYTEAMEFKDRLETVRGNYRENPIKPNTVSKKTITIQVKEPEVDLIDINKL